MEFVECRQVCGRLFEIADSQMAAMLPEEERRSLGIREFRVRCISPGKAILDHAKEEDIDVIVMGTHGREGATRHVLGSVAAKVLRHAPCPVLPVRGDESAAEAIDVTLHAE